MTIDQLIEFCKPVSLEGSNPETLGKLCQDSRVVENNDIFIAISGIKSDGHNHIREAVANGASVIISEKDVELESDILHITVKNTRKLLGPLAQRMVGNPAKKLVLTGITGTNGKTTVATLVWQVLTKMGYKASLLGTVEKRINQKRFQSKLTTSDPIELANDMRQIVDAGSTHLIMEVSSHALSQKRVSNLSFAVAAFTNLSHDHLDYHKSMEEYASAKKMLFNSLDNKSWAITNVDDPKGEWMTNSTPAKILSFSLKGKGLINASIISSTPDGMVIKVDDTPFHTPLAGDFNAYNVVQALLISTALGLDGSKVSEVLGECYGAPGRLEKVAHPDSIPGVPTIFVDYAHTPDALENVASTLKNLKSKRDKLIIMFGCGGDRDKKKRPEMALIAEKYGNRVVVTSDNPRSEDPLEIIDDIMSGFKKPEQVTVIPDRAEAIKKTISDANQRTMILIAGKGHETYQEIQGERIHFDDREHALTTLKQKNGHPETEEVH
tara:strand:- start:28418 stop:29905 length:1488 start_codon:yes stop_codon:yes gene_type:complete